MYLYVFDDGSFRQSQNPPSDDDLKAVNEALLTVITVVGGRFSFYTGEGRHLADVPEAGFDAEINCTLRG